MKKAKLTAGTAATFLIVGTTAFQAFAADPANALGMPDGTAVMGNQAYSLTYANDAKNQDQITNLIVNSNNQVYVKDFSGSWINNAGGASMNTADIPAVTYTDDAGKVTKFDKGDVPAQDAALSVSSVSAITDKKISVKLSAAVDDVSASNFSIAGATVTSATPSADKTEVKLEVQGLQVTKSYTVKATGLKISGKVQPDTTKDFVMPDASKLFTPEITFKDSSLKADGVTSTLVTLTLKDANGNVMTDADNVEVGFTSALGRFANNRVTTQNGVATVLLTSETLDAARNCDITATVLNDDSDHNLEGIKATRSILFDPNAGSGSTDEKVGARMTEVQAAQADRVIAYFNKDVDYTKYTTAGTYAEDTTKADITVSTNVADNGDSLGAGVTKTATVVGVLPVQGNSKALQLVLSTSQPLVDNSNFLVDFTDKTGTVKVGSGKVIAKLTDSRKPALLNVERDGLNKLKLTFSEPVNGAVSSSINDAANYADLTSNDSSASIANNWVIDGFSLNDDLYGAAAGSGSRATAYVGTFNTTTGSDERNVVTITLGKDKDGNQKFFKAGDHSIQGSSIGDWANLTDKTNNVMETQTLQFSIPVDKTAPNASVVVQSPEQYIVAFDKDVNFLTGKTPATDIKLQKYNKSTGAWEDTSIPVSVKPITVDGSIKYKVEVINDWTVTYDTDSTHLNYYNDTYRLYIAKDVVSSASNGVNNSDISLVLGGAMTSPDLTSPIINSITENVDPSGVPTGSYDVTMSEPIKGFDGFDSLAQRETKVTPTAQFIKKDGSKTVNANVTAGTDKYDEHITVTPSATLEPGDWTLVVRSISDDVGNTASSLNKDFTVKASDTKTDKFSVVWARADKSTDGAANDKDYVYVKFNKAISSTGDSQNVLKTSNYQLDGMPLPTGTQIRANISNPVIGRDDADSVVDSITIVLPDKYLNGNDEPHVLTISNYIQSSDGEAVSNGGAKKLTWRADLDTAALEVATWENNTERDVYALELAANDDLKDEAKLVAAEGKLNTARLNVEKTYLSGTKTLNYADASIEGTELTARYNTAKATVTAARSALQSLPTRVATGYATTTYDSKTATYTATVATGKDATKLSDILADSTVKTALTGYTLTAADVTAAKTAIAGIVPGKAFADVTLADLKANTSATTPLSLTIGGVTYKIVVK